jgi:ubiquinone/menaquinone biosynthesis C-methylase UbiE
MTGSAIASPGQSANSGYCDVDHTGQPEVYIRRLDTTRQTAFWQSIKRQTFDLVGPREGTAFLDVGCGSGEDALAIARMVRPNAKVVGVDRSAVMVAEARRRAAGTGLPVSFEQHDAYELKFPDASFDGCRAERVLQHVYEPRAVVHEMLRVARQGARMVIAEPDYGMVALTGANPLITRKVLASRCQHFRSGKIGRQLARIFTGLGLTSVTVSLRVHTATVLSDRDRVRLYRSYAQAACADGTISESEAMAWLDQLEAASRAGRYRYSLPVFVARGIKTW